MRTKMAYCYCRVSSGHQTTEKGGYGMSRQQGMLMDYVDEYSDSDGLGYELSSESVVFLNAEGVSGFSGANLAKGSVLLAFIEDVKAGKIKNAVLCIENIDREGANKQVISSQADSLIKISRIWADFFPQTHRISLFRLFFPPFLALFPVFTEISPTDVSFGPPETGWPG